jgi:glycosyltransferase involved in cell wall biosynthesis
VGEFTAEPAVSVIMPVLDEARMLGPCLDAIAAQTYRNLTEIVLADGGSTDGTAELARRYERVRIVENPRQSRPAGLNVAIAAATGEVIVRVDARTRIEAGYVERCVAALESSAAAIVGGPMRFLADTPRQRAIAAAMLSRIGAGPAEFRRLGGEPRFVDTVYLGAYRAETIAALGGYDEWSGGNEDAELAHRAQAAGGVYLDPAIRSRYVVREGLRPLARQFYRYGRNRARTVRKHPGSLSPRQLAVPALFAALASPWRKPVALAYVSAVCGRGLLEATRDPLAAPVLVAALPTMHAAWGVGFLRGIAGPLPSARR